MKPLRAILFDFDGTLLNTIDMILQSFHQVLSEYDLTATDEAIKATIGLTMKDALKRLLGERYDLCDAFIERYRAFQKTIALETCALYPPVEAMLQSLSEKEDLPLALVTSRARESYEELARHFGLADFFDVSVCGGEAKADKPSGAPLLLALAKINALRQAKGQDQVDAKDCLYVGDTEHDVLAAKDAGMHAALVTWSMYADQAQLLENVDLRLSSGQQILNLLD